MTEQKKSSSPLDWWNNLAASTKALAIGGAAFGVLFFSCCGGCLSLLVLRSSSPQHGLTGQVERQQDRQQSTRTASPSSKRVSSDDVAKLALGMSPEEVIGILGEPDYIQRSAYPPHDNAVLFCRYNGGDGKFGFNPSESTFVHFAHRGVPTGGVTMIQFNGNLIAGGP